VTLSAPVLPGTFPKQPCSSSVPSQGLSTLVVRLSNPLAEGLNNINRVENEVATMYLVQQSVKALNLDTAIPSVYAWAPYRDTDSEEGFGWVITEFMSGSDLNEVFWSLPEDTKKHVIEQIADLLRAIQGVQLPKEVTKFGAMTIDSKGRIISGQMPLVRGGPWKSYSEIWDAKLRAQLAEADESSLLQGWRSSGPRERLEHYIESGQIQNILKGVDVTQRTLVHGDFSKTFLLPLAFITIFVVQIDMTIIAMNNMLYDSETKRITALLDFDWSSISHPSDEYFSGLWDIFGGIHERVAEFQAQVLAGTFADNYKPLGISQERLEQWEVAEAWNTSSSSRGLIRPCTIAGIDKLKALKDLEELICPFHLGNEVMLKRMKEDVKLGKRAETEQEIVAWLGNWESQ